MYDYLKIVEKSRRKRTYREMQGSRLHIHDLCGYTSILLTLLFGSLSDPLGHLFISTIFLSDPVALKSDHSQNTVETVCFLVYKDTKDCGRH